MFPDSYKEFERKILNRNRMYPEHQAMAIYECKNFLIFVNGDEDTGFEIAYSKNNESNLVDVTHLKYCQTETEVWESMKIWMEQQTLKTILNS